MPSREGVRQPPDRAHAAPIDLQNLSTQVL